MAEIVSPAPDLPKKHHPLVIIGFLAVVVIVGLMLIGRSGQPAPAANDISLSAEDKERIINSLAAASSTPVLSNKQKDKIIQSLADPKNDGSAVAPALNDEQKQKIIQSLSAPSQ